MFHHLLHPLRVIWHERIALFWPIWMTITALGIMMVLWVIPRRAKGQLDRIKSAPRKAWSRADILALGILFLFLGCYCGGILKWEDFTYYDNSHFTNGTLIGHNIPIQVSPEEGRFWPLGHQEFNLLRRTSSSITGYHALRIAQLLCVCTMLLFLEEESHLRTRIALILLLLITPSILISFSGLIYPEANLLFWLVLLAWSVKCFEQSQSVGWAVIAVISVQFLLFYKETAFLFLLGFALGRLFLRCWKMDVAGLDLKRLKEAESLLDICLAFMVVPFLLYYVAAMFPVFGMGYSNESKIPLAGVITTYLELDVLAWILVAVVLAKLFLILRRRATPSLLWDGLALGGVSYFSGYICLHMVSSYYLAPVDLIAVVYVGQIALLSLDKVSLKTRLCSLVVCCLVLLQDVSLSAFRMYERKNVIHAKAEMGQVIKQQYQNDPQSVKRLFFPFARPFYILEFASYLNYIGVPIEEKSLSTAGTSGGVLLAGKTIQSEGPCGYRAFVCHPAKSPDRGDLVVVFPDDLTTVDESKMYREAGPSLLFFYSSFPPIPDWMRPIVSHLHVVSPIFSRSQLPDSWLDASISVWKRTGD